MKATTVIPDSSTFTCAVHWEGDNSDYETFPRLHDITLPGGRTLRAGGAHLLQEKEQTNPEELFAASVASCMMMTVLAVFSRSRIPIVSYDDHPEALLELVDRRYRITRVTLRPRIVHRGPADAQKLTALIEKSHANCFITLSVKSEVVLEPTFVQA